MTDWKSLYPFGITDFEIDSFGNIRHAKTKKYRNVYKRYTGRKYVSIPKQYSITGRARTINVGSFVLRTFGDYPADETNVVGYKDDNYDNTHILNLFWMPRRISHSQCEIERRLFNEEILKHYEAGEAVEDIANQFNVHDSYVEYVAECA